MASSDAVEVASGLRVQVLDASTRAKMIDLLVYRQLLALECERQRIVFQPEELVQMRAVEAERAFAVSALASDPGLAVLLEARAQSDLCEESLLAALDPSTLPAEAILAVYEFRHGRWTRDQPWLRATIATISALPANRGFTTCGDFLEEYQLCIDRSVPEAERHAMQQRLQAFERDVAAADARGTAKKAARRCASERARVRAETTPMGCEWEDGPPPTRAEREASTSAARRLAEDVRRSVRNGTAFELAAKSRGFVVASELVPLDRLAPMVRTAVGTLKEGAVSAVAVDGDQLRLVQRTKSWPVGTLPKAEPELREAARDVAYPVTRRVLEDELRRRYEVVVIDDARVR